MAQAVKFEEKIQKNERGDIMMTLLSIFETPEIIQEFLTLFSKGCNMSININYTDALNGYGLKERIDVIIYILVHSCTKNGCGYHSLYNDESICNRCKIKSEYKPVFDWHNETGLSLEQAFVEFLKSKQNEFNYELAKKIGLMLDKWSIKNDENNIIKIK